jgi:hypothetical protein
MLVSRSIDGATIREGGSSALGRGVGVGVGVGGGGNGVDGGWVAVGSNGGCVTVHCGSSSGVGPLSLAGRVGSAVKVGTGVSVGVMDVARVGSRVGAAVSASTTAPSSVMVGSGGTLTRDHTPQPIPPRIRSVPRISMALERIEALLLIVAYPSETALSCQVNLPCGIIYR